MVVYKRPPTVRRNSRFTRKKKKQTSDIIVQNWHLECHEEGSREYKITMALALESDFNDLDVVPYMSNDGRMLCRDIGD